MAFMLLICPLVAAPLRDLIFSSGTQLWVPSSLPALSAYVWNSAGDLEGFVDTWGTSTSLSMACLLSPSTLDVSLQTPS